MGLFPSEERVRPPGVAGMFYPDLPVVLKATVSQLLADLEVGAGDAPVRAVIVPHAGYRFSGAVAGRAIGALARTAPRRVFLVGPSHRAAFAGAALPGRGVEAFATPLGEAPLDTEVLERLRAAPGFDGPPSAHDEEHCLEVLIPMLQGLDDSPLLVPILIGGRTSRDGLVDLAQHLGRVIDEATVMVVSTDFSHHGPNFGWAPFAGLPETGERMLDLARSTVGRAADIDTDGFWFQTEVSGDTVCGRGPVQILLELLTERFEGTGEVLDVTTSGHLVGDFTNSVSYASAVFRGRWVADRSVDGAADQTIDRFSPDDQEAVASLARSVLMTRLGAGPEVARWFAAHGRDARFRSPAGAFVSLHHRHPEDPSRSLRACMGVMDSTRPMTESVVKAAVSAARDPRFEPVRLEELEDLTVEVSVLSPTMAVPDADAIEVGVHGVALEKSGRSAVFLPHVATEQGWDRDTMLDALARKAGLPADGWRNGARFGVFTAQICREA
jgi:AmmeMemoRadiSam system protein B/AmmeMemoRadiSam system protein A